MEVGGEDAVAGVFEEAAVAVFEGDFLGELGADLAGLEVDAAAECDVSGDAEDGGGAE